MRRRSVLSLVGGSLAVGLSGCQTSGDGRSNRDDIETVVHNQTADALEVRVTISSAGETVHETTLTVPANDQRSTATGISDTGQYELAVSIVDGPGDAFQFTVDDYDLNTGANQHVEITEDTIRMYVEE